MTPICFVETNIFPLIHALVFRCLQLFTLGPLRLRVGRSCDEQKAGIREEDTRESEQTKGVSGHHFLKQAVICKGEVFLVEGIHEVMKGFGPLCVLAP